jgi:hypothetical protein
MRDKAYKNDNFYKTKSPNKTNIFETEKHRIWLDLIKQDGGSHRTLIGYSQGATLDKDVMFDASFEVSGMNIYSLIENKAMIIQGRSMPFNNDDQVPIGINIHSEGEYYIAIGDADGLFLNSSQNIFLEDTKVNIVHDLKLSPYSFYSEKGNYQNRFILRYTDSSLKTTSHLNNVNSINVFTNKNNITIKSSVENIQNITIYDIVGRKIVEMKNENSSEIIINNIHVKNQSLILKIELQNGEIISKKTAL